MTPKRGETTTPKETQELRDWSAGKMGWTFTPMHTERGIRTCYIIVNEDGSEKFIMYRGDWHPDTDLNQAFRLVERMAELGWYLSLDQSMREPHEWTAQFFWSVHSHPVGLGTQADNAVEAIILAAMATEGK